LTVWLIGGVSPYAAIAVPPPRLTSNQADYAPEETAVISGVNIAPSTSLDIPIIRPDNSIVKGDGSFAEGWDTVTSSATGAFTYDYHLDGIIGTYTVRVYPSGWSGDRTLSPVAAMTFTDMRTDFRQCRNDSDNNDVKDDCEWSTGASGPNNSIYVPGETVPQRLLQVYDLAGTHTVELEYDFTKNDVYAYDFLSNVDDTQAGALLNPCGQLPNFITSPPNTCSGLSSGAVAVAIPSDAFDGVASREAPAVRNLLIGGSSAPPTVTIVGHSPSTVCVQNCGTSTVTVEVSFATSGPDQPIAVWFGGHLASSSSAPVGWGAGFGADSIFGAPFHVALGHGGRDNQILLGSGPAPTVPEAPFAALLALGAVAIFSFAALSGSAGARTR
jgi:hypothetical protein